MLQLWLLQHLPPLVFVFSVGACVGSFLNVVLYRLPLRMSVINPPSRCSTCGRPLRFFSENLPIIGWFLVRGTCRSCGGRVSCRYMLVEVAIALLFTGIYALLYLVPASHWWFGAIGGPWWRSNQFMHSFPAFFAVALLVVGLIAMTVIDARTFEIPIEIPAFLTGAGLVLWPAQLLLAGRAPAAMTWPLPGVSWPWAIAALAGLVGWGAALLLLRVGRIPYSFADYEQYVPEGETLADYPHGRREMGKELLFLAPIVVALGAGWATGGLLEGVPPRWLQAATAPIVGYFAGGGIVWAIRILGTLGFGREAMGMGDVHLLGAVGAVAGWFDAVLAFFVAPFIALAWVIVGQGLLRVLRRPGRELPFGPHLAMATLAVLLCRPVGERLWTAWAPGTAFPERGFVALDDEQEPGGPAARPGRRGAETSD